MTEETTSNAARNAAECGAEETPNAVEKPAPETPAGETGAGAESAVQEVPEAEAEKAAVATEESPLEAKAASEKKQRVFKIGATRIVADASLEGKSNSEVREMLKSQFPEIAHSTIREKAGDGNENGTTVIEFAARPGHKG